MTVNYVYFTDILGLLACFSVYPLQVHWLIARFSWTNRITLCQDKNNTDKI